MNTIRLASILLAVVAAALLMSGTMSVSSLTADREAEIQTVPDEEAYVGYEQAPGDVFFGHFDDLIVTESGQTEAVIDIENRFGSALNVTDVSADTNHITLSNSDRPQNLAPGERETIHAEVHCGDVFFLAKEQIGVSVTVESASATATLDGNTVQREATVVCFNHPDYGFELRGAGSSTQQTTATTAAADAPAPGGHVEATVWIADTHNGTVDRVAGTWNTGADPRGFDPTFDDGVEIVAIVLNTHELAFARPGWQRYSEGNFDADEYLDAPPLAPFTPER